MGLDFGIGVFYQLFWSPLHRCTSTSNSEYVYMCYDRAKFYYMLHVPKTVPILFGLSCIFPSWDLWWPVFAPYYLPPVTTMIAAGRQLPTANAQPHGHGRAPDHHWRRFVTRDRHAHPGPTPVAVSPHKLRHRPILKSWRFWVVFTCTDS
jgi:hypothetical protein